MAGPDKDRLYAALPTALQHLATAAYGLHMRRVRRRGAYRETRRQLARTERSSAAELREIQAARLRALVGHAVGRTRYYRELFARHGLAPDAIRQPEDLRRVPRLAKATILERGADLRAPAPTATRVYYTSGTSGTTLAVPIDDASRQRNYAFFDRSLAWAGVEGGRSATFAGRPVVPSAWPRPRPVWRWNPAMRNRLFSSYHLSPDNAPAYAEALCAWAPDYIDSYPSAVATLAAQIEEQGLAAPRPRAIVTSAETLLHGQRELVERVFGAPCFDQYGCTEQAVWISQCQAGTYHVHPEFGIVEILDPDGEPVKAGEAGEIVATSFTNDALPLLRYRTGDVAVAGTAGCGCGRAFPVVRALVGRRDDQLVTPDGRRIGRLDPVFKGLATVREAQIEQCSAVDVIVRLVPGAGYTEADGAAVARELAARLGSAMHITIEPVASIPRTASGKFRAVINRHRPDPGQEGQAQA